MSRVPGAWKSHDWDALDRLHAQGYISDPKSKAKSVVLSAEGVKRAREFIRAALCAQSRAEWTVDSITKARRLRRGREPQRGNRTSMRAGAEKLNDSSVFRIARPIVAKP